MAYYIFKDPNVYNNNRETMVSEDYDKHIVVNNLYDEMKLEAFLEGSGDKTLEQIQEFFKK